jgi:hypothetical protein
MNSNKEPKQIWSRDDTFLVTRCYLDGKSLQETHLIMPNIKLTTLKTKLASCLYLDKNDSKTRFALKNVSKMHQDVWDELKGALAVPDVEVASVAEEGSEPSEEKEDGEKYFMCTGSCDRVCHYEDTNEHGMCGKCEYKIQKKCKKYDINIRCLMFGL